MFNSKFVKKEAFTLIEAMVASSILVVGLVSVIGMFSIGVEYSSSARQSAEAVGIMQEVMESSIALGYDNIIIGAGNKARFSDNLSSPFYCYQTKTDISFVDGNLNETESDSGLKKIKVTVFWDVSGIEKKEEVATLLARQ